MAKSKKIAIILLLIFIVILAATMPVAMYIGDFYRADGEAVDDFLDGKNIEYSEDSHGNLVFAPEGARLGFIFYPGGKVEKEAYIPLMVSLAERGVHCVLLDLSFNLAILDMNAAEGISEEYPKIEGWYVGGHSLGGVAAASFAAENSVLGIVLLASYPTVDISTVPTLSVYGSLDGVMNMEKYNEGKALLPGDAREYVIEGGNHSGFGMYGHQAGDGESTLAETEQIFITRDLLLSFFE